MKMFANESSTGASKSHLPLVHHAPHFMLQSFYDFLRPFDRGRKPPAFSLPTGNAVDFLRATPFLRFEFLAMLAIAPHM